MSETRKWSLMAGVLVAAVLAAGWFLLIAPKRTEAAGLREQTVTQEDANARLVQKLAVLKAQQAELPEKRAELAVMREQIPDNPELPTLVRDLTAAGRKVGVSIDTMAPSVPVAVVAAAPAAPAATSTGTTSTGTTGTGTTGTTGGTPAAPAPPAPALYQVPLNLTVTGGYFELEQFVNKLESLRRSFLVTGFSVSAAASSTDASTAGGSGTVAPGDLTLSVTGRVYLSPTAAAPATQPTPAASTATSE